MLTRRCGGHQRCDDYKNMDAQQFAIFIGLHRATQCLKEAPPMLIYSSTEEWPHQDISFELASNMSPNSLFIRLSLYSNKVENCHVYCGDRRNRRETG